MMRQRERSSDWQMVRLFIRCFETQKKTAALSQTVQLLLSRTHSRDDAGISQPANLTALCLHQSKLCSAATA